VVILVRGGACNGRATPDSKSAADNQRSKRAKVNEFGLAVGNQRSQRRAENLDTVGVRSSILRSPTLNPQILGGSVISKPPSGRAGVTRPLAGVG